METPKQKNDGPLFSEVLSVAESSSRRNQYIKRHNLSALESEWKRRLQTVFNTPQAVLDNLNSNLAAICKSPLAVQQSGSIHKADLIDPLAWETVSEIEAILHRNIEDEFLFLLPSIFIEVENKQIIETWKKKHQKQASKTVWKSQEKNRNTFAFFQTRQGSGF